MSKTPRYGFTKPPKVGQTFFTDHRIPRLPVLYIRTRAPKDTPQGTFGSTYTVRKRKKEFKRKERLLTRLSDQIDTTNELALGIGPNGDTQVYVTARTYARAAHQTPAPLTYIAGHAPMETSGLEYNRRRQYEAHPAPLAREPTRQTAGRRVVHPLELPRRPN